MGGKVSLSENVVGQGMVTPGVGPTWMVNATGAQKNRGFTATVVRNGVGDYSVQLTTQYPADDLHVRVYPVRNQFVPLAPAPAIVGVSTIVAGTPGPTIRVLLKDSAAGALAPADIAFAIVVTLQEVSH